MAKQRYVNTKFWDDKYIRSLDPNGKLLFIYLFTNSLATIAGAYEIELERMRFDTGIPASKIVSLLEKFKVDGKAEFRDGWLLMINTVEHQATVNAKIRKGVEETVKCCPDWIKDRLSIAYDWLSHLNSNLNSNLNPNSNSPNEKGAVPQIPNSEIDIWMNAVATAVGAKDGKALRPFERWKDVCSIAVREQRGLEAMLAAIKFERNRCGADVQFFTPEGVLKRVQMAGSTQSQAVQPNRPTARQLIAEARAQEEALAFA